MSAIRESVASYRSAAKENPLVSRYQWLLADGLRSLAAHLELAAPVRGSKGLLRGVMSKSSVHSLSGWMTVRYTAPP